MACTRWAGLAPLMLLGAALAAGCANGGAGVGVGDAADTAGDADANGGDAASDPDADAIQDAAADPPVDAIQDTTADAPDLAPDTPADASQDTVDLGGDAADGGVDAADSAGDVPAEADADAGTAVVLYINEFVVTPNASEAVELYNPGIDPVSLDGWTLHHTDAGGTRAYTFNTGLTVPAGGFLNVPKANFGVPTDPALTNVGAVLELRDPDGASVDRVGYGTMGGAPAPIFDFSTARVGDGVNTGDDAVDFNMDFTPSMGAANNVPGVDLGGAEVVVNELFINTASGTADFVELYNTGAAEVDITGWTLILAGDDYVVPATTTVPASGFWVLGEADYPPFSQPGAVGNVYLFDETGVRLQDLSWTAAAIDGTASKGFFPDGNLTGGLGYDLAPTEGAANRLLMCDTGVDLDGNLTVDRTETLIGNPGLDVDLAGWDAGSSTIDWLDGAGLCGGGLQVTASLTHAFGREGSVSQCVSIPDNTVNYHLAFAYFLQPDQPAPDGVYARAGYYTSANCAGGTRDGWEDLPRSGRWSAEGSWQVVNVDNLDPSPSAQSILLELIVRDADVDHVFDPIHTLFDEVLLRAE